MCLLWPLFYPSHVSDRKTNLSKVKYFGSIDARGSGERTMIFRWNVPVGRAHTLSMRW